MISTDENNLTLAKSQNSVDAINGRFYGKFPYPWPPAYFDRIVDPTLETVMLNQSVGNWDRCEILPHSRIWVAGCGTNQAVFAALKFPQASIMGSDLSVSSLQIAANSAKHLGLTNLELRQQSINESDYRGEFDYVICTGVIHHNSDPQIPLKKLRQALRPSGICELMVYNRYHRTWTTAFQKAVQVLSGAPQDTDLDTQMDVTKRILRSTINSSMAFMIALHKEMPEAAVADSCMQPIEHSYTVESLEALLNDSGFEMLVPCLNQFDRTSGNFIWNMSFEDPELGRRYDALPDSRRWQVSNLLLLERAPHLWFYIQRTDCSRARKSEIQICNEFLERRFRRVNVQREIFTQNGDRSYALSAKRHNHPSTHTDVLCRTVLAAVDEHPGADMRTILGYAKVKPDFAAVQRLRLLLATCAHPYLIAADMVC